MKSKLKPCPFCGSTNIELDHAHISVVCGDCCAEGPFGDADMAVAIETWNRRAQPAEPVKVPRPNEFNTGNQKLDTLLDDTYYLVEDGGMENAIKWHESLTAFLSSIEPAKKPSDDELKALAMSVKEPGADGFILRFARALLYKYGQHTATYAKRDHEKMHWPRDFDGAHHKTEDK